MQVIEKEPTIPKPCFDPASYICLGCIMTDDIEETVNFHLLHLELDHGITIHEDSEGRIHLDQEEYYAKGAGHH